MKNDKPPKIGFAISILFGVLPGVAFALSIYLSLAVVTLLARVFRILG